MESIDVFYDLEWSDYFSDNRMQFRNGRCLAQQVLGDCPEGKKAALLLTCLDEKERSFQSPSFFVLVINFPRYLELANANAAVSYLARNFAPGITSISAFDDLGARTPEEIRALLDQQLTVEQVGEWVAGDAERISDLRQILDSANGGGEGSPPSLTMLNSALEALEDLDASQVEQLKTIFAETNISQLANFLNEHDLLPEALSQSLDYHRRCRATEQLEALLEQDLREAPWQKWFEENDWVLGTEFVRIIDERPIDVEHIADYLMQAYDGFLDLVEIKRPEGSLKFWADTLDHGNYVPHSDLVKAITQANRYIFEVEREANSLKFSERIDGVKAIKPRCVLIFGRSNRWNERQREAYRILSASYHNLSIMTFDHVLARAKRILDLASDDPSEAKPEEKTEHIPAATL